MKEFMRMRSKMNIEGYSTGNYLTIVSTSDNNQIYWELDSNASSSTLSGIAKTISISLDNGYTWTSVSSGTTTSNTPIATLNTGEKMLIKGYNNKYYRTLSYNDTRENSGEGHSGYHCRFRTTGTFNLEGNIMSMIYGDSYKSARSLYGSYCAFYYMFASTKVVRADKLILPATTLDEHCYYGMFYGCNVLQSAPKLPSVKLAYNCYAHMFTGCKSLTTMPVLPATRLASNCYSNMFSGCTLLENVMPTLPAKSLAPNCYQNMFENCTSLVNPPALPATTLTNYCYQYMFSGCTSLTQAPALPATTLATYCYSYMFSGCTSLTQAPALPATTLTNYCYQYMFSGCTSLVISPTLPATTLVSNCYNHMFNNCSNLSLITALFTTTPSDSYTPSWVSGVNSSGVFVRNQSATWNVNGINGVPLNWTDCNTNQFTYMNIVSLSNNNVIKWNTTDNLFTRTISISVDNGLTWVDKTSSEGGTVLSTLNTGDRMLIKGLNSAYCSSFYNFFSSTGDFDVEGDIMSLVYGDDFGSNFTLTSSYALSHLFENCTHLVNANNLLLAAVNLSDSCYSEMFKNCTSLISCPMISALTLSEYCFMGMFSGCTSLISTPELPSMSLASDCYNSMFKGCTSLTTITNLPATVMADYCYYEMFSGCTSLTHVDCLPATSLAECCYGHMFDGCALLTIPPRLYAQTLSEYCYQFMFANCISLKYGPILIADTLVEGCYNNMFNGCTNLHYIYCQATDISASLATTSWLLNVAESGDFCTSINTWTTGASGIPNTWNVKEYDYSHDYLTIESKSDNNSIYFNANNSSGAKTISVSIDNGLTWVNKTSTTSGILLGTLNSGDKLLIKGTNNSYIVSNSYYSYFTSSADFDLIGNIMSLIFGDDFIRDDYTHSYTGIFSYMFTNCTYLISCEYLVLPMTTLTDNCYQYMFKGCTSLVTAPNLPATTLASYCYNQMFYGCTSLELSPSLPATTLVSNCYDSMFYNCTNLRYISTMFTTTPSSSYTNNWVYGVKSKGVFGKNPEAIWDLTGVNGIPIGWTVISSTDVPLKWTRSSYVTPINPDVNCLSFDNPLSLPVTFNTTDSSVATIDSSGNISYVGIGSCVLNAVFAGNSEYEPCTLSVDLTVNDNSYSAKYLTIVSREDNANLQAVGGKIERTISASFDNGSTWTTFVVGVRTTINLGTLNIGDKALIKGNNNFYGDEFGTYNFKLSVSSKKKYDVEGNIMSLVYGDDFVDRCIITEPYTFRAFFRYEYVVDCSNLVLPSTTLTGYCYYEMFKSCPYLTSAPVLPATTLADHCYYGMFNDCDALITAPALPATTLATSCYGTMFSECRSLINAPALPATTLAESCYFSMFGSCENLRYAPELPATTLVSACYNYMFQGCENLTYIKAMFTTTPKEGYTTNWVKSVYNVGLFVKNTSATWNVSGNNGIPINWNVISSNVAPIGILRSSYTIPVNSDIIDMNVINPLNLPLTYSSSNNSVATVSNIGKIHTLSQGVCALYATFAGDATYPSRTVTLNLVVTASSYAGKYLTFESISDNNEIYFKSSSTDCTIYIEISVNDGSTWVEKVSSTSGTLLATLNSGEKLLIRGYNRGYGGISNNKISYYNNFVSSGNFNVEGNIMSLIYGDDFIDRKSLRDYTTDRFVGLFYNSNHLVNALNLILPVERLSSHCYAYMFYNCTSLTTAPALPSTTLEEFCYNSMFQGCTSLTQAPVLPATTLAKDCYQYMFDNCTSLINPPALPATTIAVGCYQYMFRGCKLLISAPTLEATTMLSQCYRNMFQGCTSLTQAPALPSTTLAYYCYAYMFYNCTSLTTAPVLLSTSLSEGCYLGMFYGCSSLVVAPGLPATSLGAYCYQNMFRGCTSLTTAPSLPATTLTTYCYSYMFQGCTSLTQAPVLPATTLATYCYHHMFMGCSSLTKAPELPATTLANYCYQYMFTDCTSLITSPELPAITLATGCYNYMFDGCSKLVSVKALFTTTPSTSYTTKWLRAVSDEGVFVKNPSASWSVSGEDGVPTNWDIVTQDEYYMKWNYSSYNAPVNYESIDIVFINLLDLPVTYSSSDPNVATIDSSGNISFVSEGSCTLSATFAGDETYDASIYTLDLTLTEPSYLGKYLTFVSLSDNNSISFKSSSSSDVRTIFVSTDGGSSWSRFDSSTNSIGLATLNTGETLKIRGYASSYGSCCTFESTGDFDVEGNIMSMLYFNKFIHKTTITQSNTFSYLFNGCIHLINARNLMLPATSVLGNSYRYMFSGCSSLISAPELPATTLGSYCYEYMFNGCASLIDGPSVLPATNTALGCYESMFKNCTSLVKGPDILCTSAAQICCEYMFYYCTSLREVHYLYATTLSQGCYSGMFMGCSSLVVAPVLPATTLARDCYSYMFEGCSKLEYIKALFTTNISSTTNYTNLWTSGVSNTGIFIKDPSATWSRTGDTGVPTNWVVYTDNGNPIKWSYDDFYAKLDSSCSDIVLYNPYYVPVSYDSSDDSVATIDSSGNIEVISRGTCEISATVVGGGTYDGYTVNMTLIVVNNDYFDNYLTFVSRSDNNDISFKCSSTNITKTISVSTDDGSTWVSKTSSTSGTLLATLNTGDKLLVKGNNIVYGTSAVNNQFVSTKDFDIEGNIMSLLYEDDFMNIRTITGEYNLKYMFLDCTHLINAKNLKLPLSRLRNYIYQRMFYGCTSLITAPDLPATVLAQYCYDNMFSNCNSLTVAPDLPAMSLSDDCYRYMFYNCVSLKKAPKLPATKLPAYCYNSMFYNCKSLTTAPDLPATTLASYCYSFMFYNCNNLSYINASFTTTPSSSYTDRWVYDVNEVGMFVKNPSATWNVLGTSGVPSTWSIIDQTTTPLSWSRSSYNYPVNTIIKNRVVFMNPMGLQVTYSSSDNNVATIDSSGNVKLIYEGSCVLSATFAGDETYDASIYNAELTVTASSYDSSILTFISRSDNNEISFICDDVSSSKMISVSTDDGSTWVEKASTVSGELLATLNTGDKMLIKGRNYVYSTYSNYNHFASSGDFDVEGNIMSLIYDDDFVERVKFHDTYDNYTFKRMFDGCTHLINAKNLILPVTTLNEHCYSYMFYGCTSMVSAPALPATTLVYGCYGYMFQNCKSLKFAPTLPATTLATYCYQYMFSGCTKLKYIEALFTTTPSSTYTNNWVYGVLGIGMFVKNSSATWNVSGVHGIPSSWRTLGPDEIPAMWDHSSYITPINATTISLTFLNPLELPMTYSSSDSSVATIDSSCNIDFVSEGTCTLTATFAGDETYDASVFTTIVTVTESSDEVNYLTFVSRSDNNDISFKCSSTNITKTISVSTDDGSTWVSKTSSTSGTLLATLNTGDKLLVKGNNDTYGNSDNYNYFASASDFDIEGNIMSLLYEDDFVGERTILSGNAFRNLFKDCVHLKSVDNLILSATTLATYCYSYMFNGCTSLTQAPVLPATTLATNCYQYMFNGCTSLTQAPVLPVTTLANFCYDSMFYGCTSLTQAPVLPATTLATNCYQNMFRNCTSLTTAPSLPATTLATNCYQNMFNGCTSLATAPALPATTLANICYDSMFYGCTSLTQAPSLPATNLASSCYSNMFDGCTSLTTAPSLPATTLASYCYEYMFRDCTSLVTTPVLDASILTTYCYQYMFSGCTSLTQAPALPATTLATYCYRYMFNGCTSLATAPSLPATTLATYCYQNMFDGCTSLTTAPSLPATTLASYCYEYMFRDCTSLVTTPVLDASILTTYCYQYMFSGCTSLTQAPALPATTLATYCYYCMFSGCTSLTTVPALSAKSLANYCCAYMFSGCTSLRIAPVLPATTLANYCYQYMFYGCTNLCFMKALFTTNITSSTNYTSSWLSGVSSNGVFIKNSNAAWNLSGASGVPSTWDIIYDDDISVDYNELVTKPILWSKSSYEYPLYATTSEKYVKLVNPFNLPVTYSSSDSSVATIDSSGNVSYVSDGTCVLSASFAGNAEYDACVRTSNLTLLSNDTEPHDLPSEYEELEYIGTNGAAAFKVAFTPKGDTPGFVWRFKFPNESIGYTSNIHLIGIYGSSGYTEWRLYKRLNDGGASSDHAMYVYRNSSNAAAYIDFNYGYSAGWEEVSVKNNVIRRCDYSKETIAAQSSRYDYAGTFGIGCVWDGVNSVFMTQNTAYQFRFYYLSLYKASVLQYEFIPCRRLSDGKVGMYDKVNDVFHASETSVEFVAGPPLTISVQSE